MFERWSKLLEDVKSGKFKVKEVKQIQEDEKVEIKQIIDELAVAAEQEGR